MSEPYVDLHTHTTASDGTQSPAQNVKTALEAGLSAVAITDHATVAGLKEARAEGQALGIEVVPGVEISTVARSQDIHMLGYYIDDEDVTFLKRLEQLRRTRDLRNEMMIAKLQQLGIEITMDDVMAGLAKGMDDGETVGRPHIADAMVRKGYARTMEEAFHEYLGKQGQAYVNPPRITPFEAVDWIKEAGGKAVIAHPGLYQDDELVREILDYGVDGIEVYHSDHEPADEGRYLALAQEYGVLITAGSDFHGERNGKIFHAPMGTRKVHTSVIAELKKGT